MPAARPPVSKLRAWRDEVPKARCLFLLFTCTRLQTSGESVQRCAAARRDEYGELNLKALLPLFLLLLLIVLIWFLGTGRFGRAQTQTWIERARRHPRAYAFLDKHHGKFRASGHYIEFGGLFLVLYWCYDSWFMHGRLAWHPIPALTLAITCAMAAWLDELHQLKSGTRQFRRVDFLHSLCGISLAALAICYQSFIRNL